MIDKRDTGNSSPASDTGTSSLELASDTGSRLPITEHETGTMIEKVACLLSWEGTCLWLIVTILIVNKSLALSWVKRWKSPGSIRVPRDYLVNQLTQQVD